MNHPIADYALLSDCRSAALAHRARRAEALVRQALAQEAGILRGRSRPLRSEPGKLPPVSSSARANTPPADPNLLRQRPSIV